MSRPKPLPGPRPPGPNLRARGEWAEAAFLKKALGLGFAVCRPFCEHYHFDFVVVSPSGRTLRIQVKSCWTKQTRYGYSVRLSRRGLAYRADDIDFFAAYVAQHDLWYIIPVADVNSRDAGFFPHPGSHSKWERYREAWHLLQKPCTVPGGTRPSTPHVPGTDVPG